jgi:hypothetical protein
MGRPAETMSHFSPHSEDYCDRIDGRAHRIGRELLAAAAVLALCLLTATSASAGPTFTRLAYGSGEIVPIPASIPHEEGDMVDRRILPNLRWLAQRYPIYISDGYSGPLPNGEHAGCRGCHVRNSDHYNGLAVDIIPVNWSDKCDSNWRGITRLARWAEPVQNQPAAPFRWVGYDGDAGHGCGHHLHLSWEHALAPQFQLAEWVEVFPVKLMDVGDHPRRKRPTPKAAAPSGPSGGISTLHAGGVSARAE